MKKVVSPQEVAHLFANQLQDEARNANHSLYFNNDKIFSYGGHFCIAKFIDNNTLLFTERSYSNTTANHISIVRSATSHIDKIYCANPLGTHEENFKFWLNNAENVVNKLQNARKPEIYLNELNGIKGHAEKYSKYFNIDIPLTLNAVLEVTNKQETLDYLESKEKFLNAEKIRKEKEQKKQHKTALNKWRNKEQHSLYLRDGFDYLRINGDNFETSQGVKFPLAVGMRFYNNLNKVNIGDKFLDFEVKEVNKNFIQIGCHKITFKEITSAVKTVNV